MAYRIKAIPMTYCKPFECDFYPRDATLARYLLSSRVRVRPSFCLSVSINQSIINFLEWPKWRSHCKDH